MLVLSLAVIEATICLTVWRLFYMAPRLEGWALRNKLLYLKIMLMTVALTAVLSFGTSFHIGIYAQSFVDNVALFLSLLSSAASFLLCVILTITLWIVRDVK